MEEEQIQSDEWIKNLPVQAESDRFAAAEMIACAKCARRNPPNRLSCVYCGGALEITADRLAGVKLNRRKLESWEKGCNLIFQPEKSNYSGYENEEIAAALNLETAVLQQLLSSGKPLPLTRCESRQEAEIIGEKLKKNNLSASLVDDESLADEKPPIRLRGLEFDDENIFLILFNTGEVVKIPREDLILIVSGAVYERKTESIEKRKKGENKILDASEIASDELLIDVYSREDSLGYRIFAKGFDFSCLEAEKGMLAAENMRRLAEKLRERATRAKFVDDYTAIREILNDVWEVEKRKDSQGLKRHGFGKFDIANVETSNNLRQFTKYSRLQRQIL